MKYSEAIRIVPYTYFERKPTAPRGKDNQITSLAGKFHRVSKTTYRDGIVLVGFIGDVWPHDLNPKQIDYIKTFYNMPLGSGHMIFNEWPLGFEPEYPATKTNIKNGFMAIYDKARFEAPKGEWR